MNHACELRVAVAPNEFPDPARDVEPVYTSAEQVAVLAGGCFWCVEAVFRELQGVLEVTSGYSGGTAETADYRTVCSGTTDHAEAIRIRFDPARVSYGQLLKVFFAIAHDPTQLNRQGNDRGRQYRSAIFFADEEQKSVAQAYIRQLSESGIFSAPIVTTLEPLEEFHVAESYHQNYAAQNPGQPYITHVAVPKVQKLRTYFRDRLKSRS
jgi:peptide-methionine (S)-S-oxide reductase